MLTPVGRGRRAAVALLLAVAVAAFAGPAPAAADAHVSCGEPDVSETLDQWVHRCYGDIATGGTGSQCILRDMPWWGSGPVRCLHPELGWWSDRLQCYLKPAAPQPAPGDPVWQGHTPADGVVYRLACPYLHGVEGRDWRDWTQLRFLPAGQGPVDRLVDEAVGLLELAGPDIRSAPDPSGTGLVGLPVWLWTPVTATTWGPQRVRLSALGSVLVVEATVDRVVWDMGNGDTVACDTAGTPYAPAYGGGPSPDCGYPGYRRPSRHRAGGTYPVTAVSHWRVDWWIEGTGVRVSRSTTRTSATELRVHELRVVTS